MSIRTPNAEPTGHDMIGTALTVAEAMASRGEFLSLHSANRSGDTARAFELYQRNQDRAPAGVGILSIAIHTNFAGQKVQIISPDGVTDYVPPFVVTGSFRAAPGADMVPIALDYFTEHTLMSARIGLLHAAMTGAHVAAAAQARRYEQLRSDPVELMRVGVAVARKIGGAL